MQQVAHCSLIQSSLLIPWQRLEGRAHLFLELGSTGLCLSPVHTAKHSFQLLQEVAGIQVQIWHFTAEKSIALHTGCENCEKAA